MQSTKNTKPGSTGIQERTKATRKNYIENFNPEKYCEQYYTDLEYTKPWMDPFYLALRQEPLFVNRPQSQRHVLDFGCGPIPVMSGVFAAACYTDSITMSEMVPNNRRYLKSWMNSESEVFNFDKHFEYLESIQDEEMKKRNRDDNVTIAQRLKNAFQLVVPCDASMENPLDPICQRYDIVMSFGVLSGATDSEDDYRIMSGHVINLVKPGGLLIMGDYFTATSYDVSGHTFPSIQSTFKKMKNVFTSHGLSIIKMETDYKEESEQLYREHVDEVSQCARFFLIAHKPC